MADEITGKDTPRGSKTPNNEIKKWFKDHRPKNRIPNIITKKGSKKNDN